MPRPTKYSDEIAAEICARLAVGDSLATVCGLEGMPAKLTVFRWIEAHSDFAEQYDRARRHQAECHADEIIDLADSATPENCQAVKLQIDARKWVASKLLPKVYGDRQALDVDMRHSFTDLTDSELASELGRLLASCAKLAAPSLKH